MLQDVEKKINSKCYHCGDDCDENILRAGDKIFCCIGCKTVYEILSENNLCDYYAIEDTPGIKTKFKKYDFEYINNPKIKKDLLTYSDGKISIVKFKIPSIHCSSCIWLLENMMKLNNGIKSSVVNFPGKTVKIKFNEGKTDLKSIVELLYKLGYEPDLSHNEQKLSVTKKIRRSLYIKLGVAGFAFGNIMLFSFPEYLAGGELPADVKTVFNYLNILVALPVFFYCSSDYFTSSLKSIKNRYISIDIPIAMGIIALFFKSLYDILILGEPGYMDSLAGLLFFLLIGKVFQNKTYDSLNFERDYKSYFPIGINILKSNKEELSIPLSELKVGDRIIVRNNEIIPADSILFKGDANIDYSFVTGESIPRKKVLGEMVYAGGKHIGSSIELEVVRVVSQSYFTELWNDDAFNKKDDHKRSLVNVISKYFTIAVILIATSSLIFWMLTDPSKALNAFTSVLIIACPCALALSTPFTTGNALRILGRNGFYLKNSQVVEDIANVNSIIFDKTGTITDPENYEVTYKGRELSETEKAIITAMAKNSSHPLSRIISKEFQTLHAAEVEYFEEIISKGLICSYEEDVYKLGSAEFTLEENHNQSDKSSGVYFAVNEEPVGVFTIKNKYRNNLSKVINRLSKKFKLDILSGDNENERANLQKIFPEGSEFHFNQKPKDKLEFVKQVQNKGYEVLMLGDGINDAGALKQSDAGITISDNVNNFTPSSDAILESGMFSKLPDFILFCRSSKKVIVASFIFSFMYNVIGLSLAVQGLLSPVFAAILMPVSSISIMAFATGLTNLIAKIKEL